jgi:hypothetical protein
MKNVKKVLTDTEKVALLTRLLTEVSRTHLRLPDSEAYERCKGCGVAGPHGNFEHTPNCLVVRVHLALRQV